MGRSSQVNPNVDTEPEENTRKVEFSTEAAEREREDIREDARTTAAALRQNMSQRTAEARSEVPRMRTDSINPRKSRRLPSPSAERQMLSSNMKKEYSKTKRGWIEQMPKSHYHAMKRTMSNRQMLEGINRELNGVVGMRSELPPATQRRVREIDRSIQAFEATNQREHIVYTTLKSPKDHGNSRNALRRRLEAMTENRDGEENSTLTFDSYIPASHSIGTLKDSPDIVMEIRTKSGAYLGTSDTTPDASHLMGRGRVLRPVSVHEASFVKPDGTRGTRTVVQMDDVTPEPGRSDNE